MPASSERHERPVYGKVLDRIGKVADLLGSYGIDVALETGQEAAPTLKNFMKALARENVGINFDPANMILYGSGDPIAALELLLPHVRSVHLKDANASSKPGVEWGDEIPLGKGQVDWARFFKILKDANFAGELNIEREAGDQRILDIRGAVDSWPAIASNRVIALENAAMRDFAKPGIRS